MKMETEIAFTKLVLMNLLNLQAAPPQQPQESSSNTYQHHINKLTGVRKDSILHRLSTGDQKPLTIIYFDTFKELYQSVNRAGH